MGTFPPSKAKHLRPLGRSGWNTHGTGYIGRRTVRQRMGGHLEYWWVRTTSRRPRRVSNGVRSRRLWRIGSITISTPSWTSSGSPTGKAVPLSTTSPTLGRAVLSVLHTRGVTRTLSHKYPNYINSIRGLYTHYSTLDGQLVSCQPCIGEYRTCSSKLV